MSTFKLCYSKKVLATPIKRSQAFAHSHWVWGLHHYYIRMLSDM